MATNGNGGYSEAPLIFHFADVPSPDSHDFSVAVEKCPICRRGKYSLYCAKCVTEREICSGKKRSFQSFQDGVKLLNENAANKQMLFDRISALTKERYVRDDKRLKVVKLQLRLKSVQDLILKKEEECNAKREQIYEKQHRTKKLGKTLRKLRSTIPEREKLNRKHSESIARTIAKRLEVEERVTALKRTIIIEMEKYVFGVESIDIEELIDDEGIVTQALADATSHQYIRGRWEYVDSANRCFWYNIVGVKFSGSGECTALTKYCALTGSMRRTVPESSHKTVFGEWGALSLISQYTHILAYVLNVKLPYMTYIPRLSLEILTVKELSNLIGQINYNIAYLSASQGVDMTTFCPKLTIANLYSLLQKSDVGRSDPFTLLDTSFLQSVADGITNPYTFQLAPSEEEDPDKDDWSIVTETLPEPELTEELQSLQTTSYAASATDLVTSAVSAMSSFWPFGGK